MVYDHSDAWSLTKLLVTRVVSACEKEVTNITLLIFMKVTFTRGCCTLNGQITEGLFRHSCDRSTAEHFSPLFFSLDRNKTLVDQLGGDGDSTICFFYTVHINKSTN